ncbi:hypothetical protein [Dyella sp.]|uniref:hypothetical protein n=1 Tax=Dyella sp. TaxID=1869338 RepID=UPI002B49AE6A|nr:hypothetical protein [Dyella sp.]HKT29207.1 hypothetical protein [Dyella sp.]
MNTPDIKHNPHPKMRYEITLTIKDAPGPFDSAEGYVSYEVANEQCAPFERFAGIYRTPPSQHLAFSLSRFSNNEYKGIVYLDLLQDEDYYGFGMCHWSVNSVSAALSYKQVTFTTSITLSELLMQEPSTEYLWKEAYFHPVAGSHEIGLLPTDEFKHKYPERYFTATLAVKERFE